MVSKERTWTTLYFLEIGSNIQNCTCVNRHHQMMAYFCWLFRKKWNTYNILKFKTNGKEKKTKMSTTLLYILKSNCFTIIFTSVTLSIYIACSYGSISLFWSEGQHMLLDLVTRGIYIIISFNNFKIFIYDHTMSRLTIYFFFRFWIQKF